VIIKFRIGDLFSYIVLNFVDILVEALKELKGKLGVGMKKEERLEYENKTLREKIERFEQDIENYNFQLAGRDNLSQRCRTLEDAIKGIAKILLNVAVFVPESQVRKDKRMRKKFLRSIR
jgi:hypothetical protein